MRPSRTAAIAFVGQRLDAHEPLIREHRLDHRLAARADADRMPMRLDLLEQAQRRRGRSTTLRRHSSRVIPRTGRPRRSSAHAYPSRKSARGCAAARSAKSLKSWPGVILTAPVPKAGSTRGVGDDRDFAPDQRQHDLLADHRLVARVIRMHRDGGVAQHRLGPRRRDGHRARAVGERIADVPQMAAASLCDRLRGRKAPSRIADTS